MLVKVVIARIRENKEPIYAELNGMINVPFVSKKKSRLV